MESKTKNTETLFSVVSTWKTFFFNFYKDRALSSAERCEVFTEWKEETEFTMGAGLCERLRVGAEVPGETRCSPPSSGFYKWIKSDRPLQSHNYTSLFFSPCFCGYLQREGKVILALFFSNILKGEHCRKHWSEGAVLCILQPYSAILQRNLISMLI